MGARTSDDAHMDAGGDDNEDDEEQGSLAVAVPPTTGQVGNNPRTKAVVGRMRKLYGHFNHSERSASIYHKFQVPGDEAARDLITDVVTRWSSIFKAMSLFYTCYSRLMAFVNSGDVGAGARKRRLASTAWTVVRHLIGVLQGSWSTALKMGNATHPFSLLFSFLSAYRLSL